MSELGAGSGTSYPTSLDTDNNQEVNSPNAGKTRARAEVINDLASAIVAIETELGTSPKGTTANVKTFLQTQHNLDGTHKTISTDTLSATGQITSTLASGTKPLNVTSTTVCTNLNADFLDGYHASTAATYNTIALRDAGGNLYASTVVANLTGNVTGNVAGNSTTATTANRVTDGTNNIRTKIINIGAWNMDATAFVDINHGLTYSNIRSVKASIYTNDGTVLYDFVSTGGGILGTLSTYVDLQRDASGIFDSPTFNDGVMNRGFIIITYVE